MKTIELTDEEIQFLKELCNDDMEISQMVINNTSTKDENMERMNRLSKSILEKL